MLTYELKTLDDVADYVAQEQLFGTPIHQMAEGLRVATLYINSERQWYLGDKRMSEEQVDAYRSKGAVFRAATMKHTGCSSCPRKACYSAPAAPLVQGLRRDDTDAVDIVYLFSQPDYERTREGQAVGRPGIPGDLNSVLKRAQALLQRENRELEQYSVGISYAALCASTIQGDKPSAAVMRTCSPYARAQLDQMRPKLIVCFGSAPLKQLGITRKHADVRGRVLEPETTGLPAPVLVTYSEMAVAAAAGLFRTFLQDLRNGYARLLNGPSKTSLEVLSANYQLPKTMDEALEVCRTIRDSVEIMPDGQTGPGTLSVDTETTSLRPEKDGTRVIAFCFSWGPGLAATILYDHPLAPPEYLERLPELTQAIREILAGPKPKVFHNAKFDLKWIELKYGMPVNNVVWCSILGEHLLDEDKKGAYGLKALTTVWLPQFCGYEDMLHDILEAQEQGEFADVDRLLGELPEGAYAEFAVALQKYREELEQHLAQMAAYREAYAEFDTQMRAWKLAREHHWEQVSLWEASPRRRPKKPEKPKQPRGKYASDEAFAAFPAALQEYETALAAWEAWEAPPKPSFDVPRPVAPSKPPRAPKPPEDPRSDKERKFTTDAGFEKVPLHELQLYGAVDADVTRRLARAQLHQIKQETAQFSQLSTALFHKGPRDLMRTHGVPASRALGHMEYHGVRIDQDYAAFLKTFLTQVIEESHKALVTAAWGWVSPEGRPFNPDSAAHVAAVLYDRGWMHPQHGFQAPVRCLEYTDKTRKPSTTEKALKPHLVYDSVLDEETGKEKQVLQPSGYFIEQLFLYKKAKKARDTFLVNLLLLSSRDGRVHTSFHPNGTGTGRLSSSDQNLQNIPKKLANKSLKKLFIPDSDAFYFVNGDYKGAEVRVFTVYAPDPALIQALNDGLDMHSFFASKVFGLPYEDFQNRDNEAALPDAAYRARLDRLRTQIKRVVFGILYGAGPTKIAETIGADIEVAKETIQLLFKMFPAIKEYIDRTNARVERYRAVETVFGRRRRFPLVDSSRHAARAKRQAGNFLIQSTSSEIVIGQLIEMHEVIHSDKTWPEWGIHQPLHTLGVRLLLTVHDSIVLQWPKSHIRSLEPWMRYYGETRVRERYPWMPVPFSMDIEVGNSYGECVALPKLLAGLPPVEISEEAEEDFHAQTELREDAFIGDSA